MSTEAFSSEIHRSFDEIREYLEDPYARIKLKDTERQTDISYTDKDTGSRKYLHSGESIDKKFGSITKLFKLLKSQGYRSIDVEFKRGNGSSNRVLNKPILRIRLDKTMLRNGEGGTGAHSNSAPDHSANNNNNSSMNHNANDIGALGSAAQQVGLGFAELVDLKAKVGKYDMIEDQLKSSKVKVEDLEREVKDLKSEKQQLENKLALAEDRKALELERKDMSQKSLLDSPAIAGLVGELPKFMEILVSAKTGAQAPVPSGLSMPNVSDAKKQLIDYIASDEVTDEVAQGFISYVIFNMADPNFIEQLQTLITNTQNGSIS